MKLKQLAGIILRNVLGLAALFAVHFAADQSSLYKRTGFLQSSPYFFLLLLYGWIVFHNVFLFERLYLRGKRLAYAFWTLLAMTIGSFNMFFILRYAFKVSYTAPHILSFWVYTITGLGIYVIYRYLKVIQERPSVTSFRGDEKQETGSSIHEFVCLVDGRKHLIPFSEIQYLESLENYVRIVTKAKKHLVRLTLKEAEETLPSASFIRISRSHIVHKAYITSYEKDIVRVGESALRIGKVYKRLAELSLKSKV